MLISKFGKVFSYLYVGSNLIADIEGERVVTQATSWYFFYADNLPDGGYFHGEIIMKTAALVVDTTVCPNDIIGIRVIHNKEVDYMDNTIEYLSDSYWREMIPLGITMSLVKPTSGIHSE